MYTFDTNTIIYYLDDEDETADVLAPMLGAPTPVYLSVISELELLSLSSLSQSEFYEIGRLIRRLTTIPVDARIARIASTIRRRIHIKTPDAAIAATALFTGTTLVTRNVKDFENIPGLSIQPI